MTFHQLKVFGVVARLLSITKAAEQLNISQPTLSKQLKLLEREYGPLHHKVGRGIKLTSDGHRFLHSIEPILVQLGELETNFKLERQRPTRSILAIGATPSPSTILLPQVLKLFKRTHPNVMPILRTGDSSILEELLLNAEIEIGLITNPSYNPDIMLEPLRPEKVVGVVASASPLAKKSKIEEAEVAKIPLIIKTGKVLRQISAKGIKLNVVMQCDSLETMLAAVRGGLGVGVLYRDIAQPSLSKGDLKRLEIPMLNQLNIFCHIAWRRDSHLSQEGKVLLEILRSRKEISQKKPFHEKTRLISPR